MKLYYSFESTPLNFHKAFYKVISPILMAVQAILALSTIGWLTDIFHGLLVFDLIVCILSIISLAFITYGFAKKKGYAWYMVYAYLILTVLSNVVSAALSGNAAIAVGRIIGALVIPVLIGIYYYKRKPLFITSIFENPKNTTYTPPTYTPPNYVPQNQPPQYSATYVPNENKETINFCRKCGNRVINGSVFCNKCGSKIEWN